MKKTESTIVIPYGGNLHYLSLEYYWPRVLQFQTVTMVSTIRYDKSILFLVFLLFLAIHHIQVLLILGQPVLLLDSVKIFFRTICLHLKPYLYSPDSLLFLDIFLYAAQRIWRYYNGNPLMSRFNFN